MKYFFLMVMSLLDPILSIIIVVGWIAGIVLAKGFWSTVACILPFWPWYLVVEKVMSIYNLN